MSHGPHLRRVSMTSPVSPLREEEKEWTEEEEEEEEMRHQVIVARGEGEVEERV